MHSRPRHLRAALVLSLGALVAVPLVPAEAAPASGPTGAQRSQSDAGVPTLAQGQGSAPAAQQGTVQKDTDRVVVKFKDGTGEAAKNTVLRQADRETPLEAPRTVKTTVDAAAVVASKKKLDPDAQKAVVSDLEKKPEVEYAEPDQVVRNAGAANPGSTPNDPLFSSRQWNLPAADVNSAWKYSTGAGRVIGVVDTGITRHPDLDNKVVAGWDTVTGTYDRDGSAGRDTDPTDPGTLSSSANWHGTHVAGIAAAQAGNGLGIAGVAPDARIQPVRALGVNASGYLSDFADAITWSSGGSVPGAPVNRTPASVVNFSAAWDGQCSPVLKAAIDGAHARNVPVVVAAGNTGVNADDVSPANCLGAVVVGATAQSGVMTGYSNYGSMLDVLAPGGAVGGDMWSTLNTGFQQPQNPTYGALNGTSMAAPMVAGTIALMQQKNPGLGVEQIRTILQDSGTAYSGYKKIDAAAAVARTPGVYRIEGKIGAFYRAHGGSGVFGDPIMNEKKGLVDGGVLQKFSNGWSIYYSPATGAMSLRPGSGIGAAFRAGGSETGLGYPVTQETKVSDGVYLQSFRKANGQTRSIYWTAATGGHTVYENGAIGAAWKRAGRTNGWGHPVTNETSVRGTATQKFSHGVTATWTPKGGVKTTRS